MESPGHRMVILEPKVTHYGIGVEASGSGPGKAFLVTELFVRKGNSVQDLSAGQILQKINQQRTAVGTDGLEENAQLNWLAQRAAEEFSQKESFEPSELQLFLINEAASSNIRLERLHGLIITCSTEEEILEKISQAGIDGRQVGIGIKRITSGPRTGRFLVIVVY